MLPALLYGVASASLGQLAAFPLETVSRRLQMQSGPLAGSNLHQMLRQIVHEEGVGALYRSVCTRCHPWGARNRACTLDHSPSGLYRILLYTFS